MRSLLIAGFLLSLMGSLPPGLISLTVAHTAIRRGFTAAFFLTAGAAFAEFFQAWIAVELADWFLIHPAVELAFRWVAIVVFFFLAAYLLFIAKPPKKSVEAADVSLPGQFFKGLIISIFNLLAIPYWFVYCGWLRVEGWWQEGLFSTLVFSTGVMLGTVLSLSFYAWMGTVIVARVRNIALQANRFIGLIFLALALKLLFGLLT